MSEESLRPDKDLNDLDAEAAQRAEDAGVVHPAYVDYEEAIENYQDRPDTEPLTERRAREAGSDVRDASFRREVGGVDHTGVVTSDTAADKEEDESVVTETAKSEADEATA